ncbi:type II toxin-antitoxin system RelE/ParE family toxin [Candidatus Methylomirabilis sp.]|uniref:type II toxin-antitoxin system RelE family toxin n=1 Tax=Candidatus Methylomirabilis sp. TaxID=2032687 RepID=UPI00307622C7
MGRTSNYYDMNLHEEAEKHVIRYPPKQFKQVITKVFSLRKNPRPQDAKELKGYPGAFRVDQGEYRVIYLVDDDQRLITVMKIGKRNDEEVYRHLESLKQAFLAGTLKRR